MQFRIYPQVIPDDYTYIWKENSQWFFSLKLFYMLNCITLQILIIPNFLPDVTEIIIDKITTVLHAKPNRYAKSPT